MIYNNLSDVYDKKNNSYDEIRFILASLVLFAHSFVLLGVPRDFFIKLTNFQLGLGSIAVYCFFVLSGFFMIQSLESNSSLIKYIKKRVLRIIPAFWLSLGISAFILAPIISSNVNIFSFEKASSLYFFLKSGFFHMFGYSWTIAGIFPNNPKIDAINGSMWTLKHEIALYFVLPIIVWITNNNKKLLILLLLLLLLLSISNILTGFILFNIPCCKMWVISSNELPKFTLLSTYFFSGVILYIKRESIIISNRLIFFCLFLFTMGIFYGNLNIVTLFVLPYLVVVFGSIFRKKFFSSKGDYSYGMYIYAFPIQQTLVHFFGRDMNVYIFFVLSFFITLLLSIISWHFFEKRILTFK